MKRYRTFMDIVVEARIEESSFIDKAIAIGNTVAMNNFGIGTTDTIDTPTTGNTLTAANATISNLVGTSRADTNRRLSPSFTLGQLLITAHSNIAEQFMPSEEVIANLSTMATTFLEPLVKAGIRFKVNSGWRSPGVNKAVRGAKGSYHMLGLAVDIDGTGNTIQELYVIFDKIVELGLPVFELYLERNGNSSWIHISYDPTGTKPKKINRNYQA